VTSTLAARHPKPRGVDGLCLGRTECSVDPRRAKRLAHRLRARARREGLAHVVWTSPRQRCAAVGRWLHRWGWVWRIDPRLAEIDFGAWDGRPWVDIPKPEIDAWTVDFVHHRPGGGEALSALLQRVREVLDEAPAGVLVTHGGWLSAALWLRDHGAAMPSASTWPRAPACARIVDLLR